MGILFGYNVALITCKLVRLVTSEWPTPKQRNRVRTGDITTFHVLRFSPAAHPKYHTLTFYGYTTNWKSDQLLGEAYELRSSICGVRGWRATHAWLLWTPRNGEFARKPKSVVWTPHRHRQRIKVPFSWLSSRMWLLKWRTWLRWSLTPREINTARCLFHFWTPARPNVELFMSQTLIWLDLS